MTAAYKRDTTKLRRGNVRERPVRIETSEGGVLKVIGRGKTACVNFHTGRNPAYGLIENSADLRHFIMMAAKRLEIPKIIRCMYCSGDKIALIGTTDPKHPLRKVPCPECQPVAYRKEMKRKPR
jgi:hypothetical protein